jgi:hypothetical protein
MQALDPTCRLAQVSAFLIGVVDTRARELHESIEVAYLALGITISTEKSRTSFLECLATLWKGSI